MTMEADVEKALLRREIRERKRQRSAEELAAMSLKAAERVKQVLNAEGKDGLGEEGNGLGATRTVLLYWSLPDEVATHGLADELAEQGWRVVLPRMIGDGELELRLYTGRHDLKADPRYHIMEPIGRLFTDYADVDAAIIPGMAFDGQRRRLGRGKGYYDRLLPKLANAVKIGLCFSFQMVEAVPVDSHDVRMDMVVSDGQ